MLQQINNAQMFTPVFCFHWVKNSQVYGFVNSHKVFMPMKNSMCTLSKHFDGNVLDRAHT